ncbi:MAG: 30S ribosome-binding factor RbfA [Anaerovoracaceae bacterium]|jgi:ribosome-binding factor A
MKYRSERMAEEIKRIISGLLLRDLKDPRLAGMVTVSAVQVTKDGSYATVYVMSLEDSLKEEANSGRKDEILEAFNRAKGLIRREIGKQIKVRHVPDLIFKIDTSLEYGMHISKVIADLKIPLEEEIVEDGDEE